MATIANATKFPQHGVAVSTWAAMGNADSGRPETLARFPVKRVQVAGTFGGATVVLEGSEDGTTYTTLLGEANATPGDVPVSFTSAGQIAVNDNPQFIRPRTSGGSGTSITVTLTSKTFGN